MPCLNIPAPARPHSPPLLGFGGLLINLAAGMDVLIPALLPVASLEKINLRYFRETASDWKGAVEDGLVDAEREVLRLAGIESGHIVCIGCGAGREVFGLARLGYRVTGMDPDGGLLDFARRHAEKLPFDVSFEQADAKSLAEEGPRFDHAVFFNFAYAYLPSRRSRQEALRRLARRVRSGGRCLINFPVARILPSAAKKYKRLTQAVSWFGNREFEPGDRMVFRRCFMHYFPGTEAALTEMRDSGWEVLKAVQINQSYYAVLRNP